MVINPKVSATFEGLSHTALAPSLQKRFHLRNILKIVVSCIVRFIYSISPRNCLLGSLKAVKTELGFFVLVLTSLYYYYGNPSKQGRTGEKGCRSTLRLIHFEAFALMSLSLSTQAQPGFKLDASNFLLPCLVLAIIKQNFMVGMGVAVLCYVAMNSRSYSDFCRREHCRRGGGKQDDGAVVGDGLLFPLVHPSSLSTFKRCRSVSLESSSLSRAGQKLVVTGHEPYKNLEWLVFLNTPSPTVIRHISFKTLNYVSLSATEYSTLSRSEWDFFIKALRLRHVRFLNFWLPESSRVIIPTNALRLRQLIGPDDELF
ncbi:hypothetical protein QN277_028575 [Acacia crassicarpa]|uniref:Uncharacterized protein n=1 Tax=Acacia crassicarpa TaxID=499986 RepID=A0AAE1J3I2_9FABA|nr:hypothetical protein QN277_028575 [Acacia crassicarpa]